MNKIKINNIEISVEEFKRLAKENEALLKEPEVNGKYFFPKVGEKYWRIDIGVWRIGIGVSKVFITTNENIDFDRYNISIGNCYRTKEEAELALEKQQAIVRCWKWAQENTPFEPDWGGNLQDKYYTYYDYFYRKIDSGICHSWKIQFTLPYFKSIEDCRAFIEANKEDLLLLFTK